ncbi:hypothetical protein HanIR_Chr15g0767091 [Helianthus annuus]|nr:hypothetical protein HanIR_Chr15g0767091 [Helianthus annuus]KAJ0473982.1 hypothetical protein HanHA89_Chr15g0624551 [Helianthus annuus]KAJ0649554.1 hypothetical protein HanLR1_Chr15g0585621 [Helianthus annuus]
MLLNPIHHRGRGSDNTPRNSGMGVILFPVTSDVIGNNEDEAPPNKVKPS